MTAELLDLEEAPALSEASAVDEGIRYSFDEAFQEKIAALVCRDTEFAQRTDGLVHPEYFFDAYEAALVNLASRYFDRYKKAPAKEIWPTLIRDALTNKILPSEMRLGTVEKLKRLLGADISDREFVVDNVAEFARHQAVSKAILESVDCVERRDFSAIEKMMRKALDTGANQFGVGYDYSAMIDARTQERKDKAAGKLPPTGITTGHEKFDNLLYHRGWGRRELSVYLAPAKAGKTTALIDAAKHAIAKGYNVLYVTLEVAAKIIAERLDANVTGTKMMDLDSSIIAVDIGVGKFMAKAGLLKIHEYPTGSMRVSDLRRLIEWYKSQGIVFDLVCVDYADLMAPERVTDNSIENSKSVYINLRGLAMAEDFAILTATQSNREGAKSMVVKAEHVAEDFNKIRIADLIISINRTEEEKAMGFARLYFAASRNQAGGMTIVIRQDNECMRFMVEIEGIE